MPSRYPPLGLPAIVHWGWMLPLKVPSPVAVSAETSAQVLMAVTPPIEPRGWDTTATSVTGVALPYRCRVEAKVSEHGRSSRWWLSPGWLFVHLFTLALVIAMVLLGRWQLIVSDRKHFNLQNFGYAVQWWMF